MHTWIQYHCRIHLLTYLVTYLLKIQMHFVSHIRPRSKATAWSTKFVKWNFQMGIRAYVSFNSQCISWPARPQRWPQEETDAKSDSFLVISMCWLGGFSRKRKARFWSRCSNHKQLSIIYKRLGYRKETVRLLHKYWNQDLTLKPYSADSPISIKSRS